MKTPIIKPRTVAVIALAALSTLSPRFSTCFAQGSLTPPGAPAPTMKTIDQVEPRVPISATTTPGDADSMFRIVQSGSYYLTGNLIGMAQKHGIEIAVNNVTLDLMGFEMRGTTIFPVGSGPSLSGVYVSSSVANLCVLNGSIKDWSQSGVDAAAAQNSQFRDLRISNNGNGLKCGGNSVIVNCTTKPNTGQDLVAGPGSIVAPFSPEEVDPRTPISATTTPGDADSRFKITASGSYYLTGNLGGSADKHGIEIAADDVTLDLMGFEMQGTTIVIPPNGPSLSGVFVSTPVVNLCVRNGTIKNWSQAGVNAFNDSNGQYQDLRLSGNKSGLRCGVNNLVVHCIALSNNVNGIIVNTGSTIDQCMARNNGADGIHADIDSTVTKCTVSGNAGRGIYAAFGSTVSQCTANFNRVAGLSVGSDSTVAQCTAENNDFDGINVGSGSSVSGCSANNNTGDGIEVPSECLVANNACNRNRDNGDGAGIHVTGSANRIDNNNVTRNDRGIDVDDSVNLIIRNSARGNTDGNYEIVSGNRVGTIAIPPVSGAISGNGPSAGSNATDPFANFAF